jgi:Zn-dependent protease
MDRPAWARRLGLFGIVALFAVTKGKLLLLGLTKAGTFLSMMASFGVYWAAWGWKFALGLVASIYVHEMGHVAAMRRYGIEATMPMFVPGVGALVRSKQYPVDPVENARVALAGPLWGLGAALAAYAGFWITQLPVLAAVAQVGAWINLFNLLSVPPLDGGKAFSALTEGQRWVLVAVLSVALAVTRERLLILLLMASVVRTMVGKGASRADGRTLAEFAVLLVALSAMCLIPVAPAP